MTRALAIAAAFAAFAALAAARPARAQDNSTAFSVERFAAPPGANALLSTDEPEVLRPLELAFGAVGSLMARPIVLQRVGGGEQSEVSVPVEHRFGVDLLAAIGLAGATSSGWRCRW